MPALSAAAIHWAEIGSAAFFQASSCAGVSLTMVWPGVLASFSSPASSAAPQSAPTRVAH